MVISPNINTINLIYLSGLILFQIKYKPINHFQSISFKLADMATKIEASELLVYHAAWLKDKGENFIKEAAKLKSGSQEPGRNIVASITKKQAEEIAKKKCKI